MSDLKPTNIRNVPDDIKECLIADAESSGRSVADTAAAVLAEWFKLPYEASGTWKRGPKAGMAEQMQLRLSLEIRAALWAARNQWGCTQSQAANRIFAAHYGVRYEVPARKSAA